MIPLTLEKLKQYRDQKQEGLLEPVLGDPSDECVQRSLYNTYLEFNKDPKDRTILLAMDTLLLLSDFPENVRPTLLNMVYLDND